MVSNATRRSKQSLMQIHLSTAKKAFSLTEAELLTLPRECIAGSLKSYFALKDVQALAKRKFEAGALLEDPNSDPSTLDRAGVREKYQDNGRRNKGNWMGVPSWTIPGSQKFLIMEKIREQTEKEKAYVFDIWASFRNLANIMIYHQGERGGDGPIERR